MRQRQSHCRDRRQSLDGLILHGSPVSMRPCGYRVSSCLLRPPLPWPCPPRTRRSTASHGRGDRPRTQREQQGHRGRRHWPPEQAMGVCPCTALWLAAGWWAAMATCLVPFSRNGGGRATLMSRRRCLTKDQLVPRGSSSGRRTSRIGVVSCTGLA